MLRRLRSLITGKKNHSRAYKVAKSPFGASRGRFETLEDRRMLAIVWANEFDNANNGFNQYGENEAIARETVQAAIDDWNDVIVDFNFDDDDDPSTVSEFRLNVIAEATGTNQKGFHLSSEALLDGVGRITETTIQLDISGGTTGSYLGWYFDSTPGDDSEFTSVANPFQASFFDKTTLDGGGQRVTLSDFYRIVTHEIGHALGIIAPNNLVENDPFFDQLAITSYLSVKDGIAIHLEFNNPTGTFEDFTVTLRFGHVYEMYHPDDMMNSSGVLEDYDETVRRRISDLDAKLLANAYGYSVVLPSVINTFHASLDEQTGTLLIQGLPDTGGFYVIDVNEAGTHIRVQGNGTKELFPIENVTEIIASNYGGNLMFPQQGLPVPVQMVDYVVSSNEDGAEPVITVGDGSIDFHPNAPGNLIPLRAAIQEANFLSSPTSIFLSRGAYDLTLTGSGGDSEGDFDITTDVTIIGAGAGETVIDAGGTAGLDDRIFHVSSGGTLALSNLTLTGADLTNKPQGEDLGGAIRVDGGQATLTRVAIVDNAAVSGAAIGNVSGNVTIVESVVTGNHTDSASSGAIYGDYVSLTQLGATIVASNSGKNFSLSGSSNQASLENNLFDSLDGASSSVFNSVNGDVIDTAGAGYVVTGVGDTVDASNDSSVLSLRDAVLAIDAANDGMNKTIWLPAWTFRLTRVGEGGADVGDIDIFFDVSIQGIQDHSSQDNLTIVDGTRLAVDSVFDEYLVGDFNGDGAADTGDLSLLLTYFESAGEFAMGDANNDGFVDTGDLSLLLTNFMGTDRYFADMINVDVLG